MIKLVENAKIKRNDPISTRSLLFLVQNVTREAYAILLAVKNTAFKSVYERKNHAYCAVVPILAGIAKLATRVTAQPIYA